MFARQPCDRIPEISGLRPVALRPTLSDGLPLSGCESLPLHSSMKVRQGALSLPGHLGIDGLSPLTRQIEEQPFCQPEGSQKALKWLKITISVADAVVGRANTRF